MRTRTWRWVFLRSPLTFVALGVLLNPSSALGQSCPSRIPTTGIRNPDMRRVTESKVIDQAFIDQNGGAEAMMAAIRQQNVEFERALRQAEICVAQSSNNPAEVRAGSNVPGSCKATVEQLQDAIRAHEAWLPVLQCWASRGGRGGAGSFPTSPGSARTRTSTATDIQALLGALSGMFGRGTQVGEPTPITPPPPIDPTLVRPGAKPLLGGSATNAVDASLVDEVLSNPAAVTALPFEYEMARTARPDRDFLKRIAGEMRSTGTAHELVFHVGDIDRNWLTTDQCVTLDVAFQATFDNGGVRAFPVSSVPINAADGTADVRVLSFAGQSGKPTDIRVTSATARACGAAPPAPPVDCTDSFQAREDLLKRATQILQKRDAIYDGISVLQDSVNSVRADQSVTESGLTQVLMGLAGAGAVAEAALTLGGVTSPAIQAIRAGEDLGNYILQLKELAQSGAPLTESWASFEEAKRRLDTLTGILQNAANADLEKGTSAAEYLLRGPRPQEMKFNLAILGRLKSAWTTLDRAAERGRAYQAARETLSTVSSRLNAQLARYREDLASSKQALDMIHARLSELTAACSTTGAKK